jgi:hypothetical protein
MPARQPTNLRALKEDSDPITRANAGLALSQVAPGPHRGGGPAVILLKDSNYYPPAGLLALGPSVPQAGPRRRDARPTLVELAQDRYRVGLRTPALRSLVGIGAEADAVTAGSATAPPRELRVQRWRGLRAGSRNWGCGEALSRGARATSWGGGSSASASGPLALARRSRQPRRGGGIARAGAHSSFTPTATRRHEDWKRSAPAKAAVPTLTKLER